MKEKKITGTSPLSHLTPCFFTFYKYLTSFGSHSESVDLSILNRYFCGNISFITEEFKNQNHKKEKKYYLFLECLFLLF